MSISFVAAGAVSTGTNPTVVVPTGYQEGDLLVLVLSSTTTPTAPTGWTVISSSIATSPRYFIYYKFAKGTEVSLAVVITSSNTQVAMLAYRGVSNRDVISIGSTSTSTTISTNTLTSLYNNEYIISVYATIAADATWTEPVSTTSRINVASTASLTGFLVVDEAQSVAGISTTRTATLSVSQALTAISFSIIPSGRYWVGGSGTWDNTTTTNWSFSSGGTGGAPAPTSQDDVTFNSATTYTVTKGGGPTCRDFTVSAGSVTFGTNLVQTVYGSMSIIAGPGFTGQVWFTSTSPGRTVSTNIQMGPVSFQGINGGWTLGSALNLGTSWGLYLSGGSLNTNGFSVLANSINGGGTNLTFGSSIISGYNSVTCFNFPAGPTIDAGTSTLYAAVGGNCYFGPYTFYNFVSPTYGVTVQTGTATFNDFTMPVNTTLTLNADLIINGTLYSNGGTVSQRSTVVSGTVGTTRTITAAAVSLSYCDFQDIAAAGVATWSGTSLGNCGGNSGFTFNASKTVYWVGTNGASFYGNFWASRSGGLAVASNYPLAQDIAIIDNATSGDINVPAGNLRTGTIDMSVRNSSLQFSINGDFYIYGNWIFSPMARTLGGSNIIFSNRQTQTITSNGCAFNNPIIINNIIGTVSLRDTMKSTSSLTVTSGTFTTNNFNIIASTFNSTGAVTRTINLGSSLFTLTGSGTAWTTATTTGLTFDCGTSTISFTSNSSKTQISSPLTFYNIDQGGAGTLTLNNTTPIYNDIQNSYANTGATTISFTNGITTTVSNFTATGTNNKILTLNNVTIGGTTAVIALTGNKSTKNLNYLAVTDLSFTPFVTDGSAPYVWYAGNNSTNNGNNIGISFTTSNVKTYLIVSGTSWTVPADWSNINSIYLFGGGGGGGGSRAVSVTNKAGGGGGGGGGFTLLTNFSATPGSLIKYGVGSLGPAGPGGGNGSAGGTTSWNETYTASGGLGGSTTNILTSIGGAGGSGTYSGGRGGSGSVTEMSGGIVTGGGGGGSAGPNGPGGNGGMGFATVTASNAAAGGGGGNGGGSAGGNALPALGGTGGNNSLGLGGGASNIVGTNGGGGGGGVNSVGKIGGISIDVVNTIGGAGGSGGSASAIAGVSGALYGSGGSGGGTNSAVATASGGAGAQGVIFIIYTPYSVITNKSNFFLMMQ